MFERVLLGLGGNNPSIVGEPDITIRKAVEDIENAGVEILAVSRLFRTPCYPAGAGPDFVNAAAICRTDLDPKGLLNVLNNVEADYGRARKERWAERTLDIDILAIDDAVLPDESTFLEWYNLPLKQQKQRAPTQLIIPHPRLQDRAFVLIPLADIAPDWKHPILGRSVTDMLDRLPKSEIEGVTPL